jgi:hypothetical protein
MIRTLAARSSRVQALWRQRLELEERQRLRVGDEEDYHSEYDRWTATAIKGMLRAAGLYQRGMANACLPVLRTEAFRFRGLPDGLAGFRILHLSDFHFPRNNPEFMQAVRNLLDGVEADLCVLTGDYRYGYYGLQDEVHVSLGEALSGVHSRLGLFGVLGNHDLSDIVPGLEGIGIRVLINEGVTLRHHDTELWLGGIDDPHKFQSDSVEDAMAAAPRSAFKVLLAHTPERIPEAAATGVNLYLCGHTHGGQVRLPWIGALHANARCARKYAAGRWHYDGMQGYTTLGLGVTDLPVRFRCPPEALMITLQPGAEDAP